MRTQKENESEMTEIAQSNMTDLNITKQTITLSGHPLKPLTKREN